MADDKPYLNSYILSFIKILKDLILEKFWLFLIVGILSAVGGFFYAMVQKPVYQSNLTFALDEGSSNSTGIAGIAAQFGFSLGGGGNDIFGGDNIIEIIESRKIIEKALLSND